MRRLFEIDAADQSGMVVVGETNDGYRVSLTLMDANQNTIRVFLDQESFKELFDLRYKIDFAEKEKSIPVPLRLTHSG